MSLSSLSGRDTGVGLPPRGPLSPPFWRLRLGSRVSGPPSGACELQSLRCILGLCSVCPVSARRGREDGVLSLTATRPVPVHTRPRGALLTTARPALTAGAAQTDTPGTA